ncbi:MAG: nucleoside deaminase [Candidatus Gastranaerophilales bacterium]|nr:nucleoside deaminase [Candidatus Gastranaerophilales bacterium]
MTNIPTFVNEIIKELCKQNIIAQEKGFGPFSAAICDKNGKIIALEHNSVVLDNCSLHHAEINTIKSVQEKLGTYDLSSYDLSICITAEPCSMCIGALMWSGIKNIYYGTPSNIVEKLTGFDEGYKPDWVNYFENKGIKVTGNIEPEICENILRNYVKTGKTIYKPNI